MKKLSDNIICALIAFVFLFASCKKDDLESIAPVIYLNRAIDGTTTLGFQNTKIDKVNKTMMFTSGIYFSGTDKPEAYSVDIAVENTGFPDGTIPLQPDQYVLSASKSATVSDTRLDIAAGAISMPLYLTVHEDVFLANMGKKLGLRVVISNPSKYTLNEKLSKVDMIIDVSSFMGAYVDVSSQYMENPGGNVAFQHGEWNGRYGDLVGWEVAESVKNQPGGFGGYDDAGGPFLSMETWGGPLIPNGKIYQTVTLPAGKYILDVNMHSGQLASPAYIAITNGNAFPDYDDIADAMAYINIDLANLANNKLAFELTEEKQVTIGFLANFVTGFQYFRVKGVAITRETNVFE